MIAVPDPDFVAELNDLLVKLPDDEEVLDERGVCSCGGESFVSIQGDPVCGGCAIDFFHAHAEEMKS